jgi:hypothetical protein
LTRRRAPSRAIEVQKDELFACTAFPLRHPCGTASSGAIVDCAPDETLWDAAA